MDFSDSSTYYDILNLTPDASPSEIREAYLRTKATFQKDSVALYSIMDASEGEEMLRRIEKAYEVLSNPQKRKEYDRNFGQIASNVISIDRHPPMETVENAENLLVAPATSFSVQQQIASGQQSRARASAADPPSGTGSIEPARKAALPTTPAEIEEEIRTESEWSGAFLRRVREARGLGPEDVTNATRITRAYLFALEEENFAKLPAPVYIRGFLTQIARLLKLPAETAVAAYLKRYQRAHPEKFR